jgi:hypothetical protein
MRNCQDISTFYGNRSGPPVSSPYVRPVRMGPDHQAATAAATSSIARFWFQAEAAAKASGNMPRFAGLS